MPMPNIFLRIPSSDHGSRQLARVDVGKVKRKMKLGEVAERVGITVQNLSILKTGKARAIRFSTLEKLCEILECQPGEIRVYEPSGD